ncbi:MAG TPA: HD domain-containing phosphohydrolase [Nitrospiraceae bacterium]|jgi:putative nucleotidyltransferase with HDIG domain|nr:HD domain-containing phosphohydrolase [Nitrospiraceae bacterium]
MNTSSGSTALPKKPAILVVDDEAGPRDALKVILRPFFEIHAVENAHSALRVLKEHHIDLITLDQKLPDRQGIDLLQDIKHEHADVEVIIITGYGSLKSAMEGIRHGAAGYLLKPFNVTELIALINQTLEKKQRLDFLRRFLTHAGSAWGTEQDCAKTWIELKRHYPTSMKSPQEGPTPSDSDMAELLPLLSDLLEAKDRHLLNHCSRVSFYATLLANRLNLTMAEQKSLALGAFLHDIGRIALDPYTFGHGDPTEAENLKRHPEIGARMMLPLGFSAEVTQIIAYHHERYDGFGYPHGLQGEGIPLLARIVAIAQAFDHLTADSPARPTTSIEEAVRRISLEAETRFDPILTEVFVRVVNECKASLPALAIAALPTATPEP